MGEVRRGALTTQLATAVGATRPPKSLSNSPFPLVYLTVFRPLAEH